MNFRSTISNSALTLAVAFAACDSDNPTGTAYQLNGVEYGIVDAGSLQHNSTSLSGSGSLVFISPLAGITSKNSYALQFTLAEGGSLTLVANANNQIGNGLNIVFTRSGTTVTGVTQAGGASGTSFTLAGVDASSTIQLQVDIHNDETPAHVLAWNGSDFTEEAAIYNSEDAGLAAPGNGSGTYWGLILSNANVTGASVGTAKFVEGS